MLIELIEWGVSDWQSGIEDDDHDDEDDGHPQHHLIRQIRSYLDILFDPFKSYLLLTESSTLYFIGT